ncbi:unnamed protein product [Adineta steineri]|nr:unnamed protein product [Adineta steineri]
MIETMKDMITKVNTTMEIFNKQKSTVTSPQRAVAIVHPTSGGAGHPTHGDAENRSSPGVRTSRGTGVRLRRVAVVTLRRAPGVGLGRNIGVRRIITRYRIQR